MSGVRSYDEILTEGPVMYVYMNYYVTKLLSGHGDFRKYLHRMGKTASPYCLYEKGQIIDDAEHTVFECTRWQSYRSELTSTIGTITASKIVEVMIARNHRGLIGSVLAY